MTRTIRALTGLGLVVAIFAGCSLTYPTPRKFAILYGIATYPAGNSLAYPDDDALAMETMLLANGFAAGDVITRINAPATKANLVLDLASVAAVAGPNDLVVFYYSGHGTVYPYQGVNREWILPTGSIDAGGSFVSASAIYDAELGAMLDVLSTTRRVVILDSCNSGGFIGDGVEADTVPAQLDGGSLWAGTVTPATVVAAIANYATFSRADSGGASPYNAMVIAAAGAGEFSYESSSAPYNGHGVLTHFLLQAPANGDLNGDGVVTVLETFALSKAGIDQLWNAAWPGTTNDFLPHISGGPIDLVLF